MKQKFCSFIQSYFVNVLNRVANKFHAVTVFISSSRQNISEKSKNKSFKELTKKLLWFCRCKLLADSRSTKCFAYKVIRAVRNCWKLELELLISTIKIRIDDSILGFTKIRLLNSWFYLVNFPELLVNFVWYRVQFTVTWSIHNQQAACHSWHNYDKSPENSSCNAMNAPRSTWSLFSGKTFVSVVSGWTFILKSFFDVTYSMNLQMVLDRLTLLQISWVSLPTKAQIQSREVIKINLNVTDNEKWNAATTSRHHHTQTFK